MNVDDDLPTCMRHRGNNNDDETKKMEDLRGKGGGRLKHRTIDGDVPLCLRKNEKDSNDDSSSKGKTREKKESGSSSVSKTKLCAMNKMASGSKDVCHVQLRKKMTTQKKRKVTFIVARRIQMGRDFIE